MATPLLQVTGLRKSFGSHEVLSGITLEIRRGQVFTILGPSGAGKSVFLKCLGGVITQDAGEVRFDGQLLSASNPSSLADFRHRCSFLFQSNALFDSLSALENVALPLEQTTDLSNREIRQQAMEALRQLEIDTFASRYPSQMSGGMQKRLALARAIVTKPELVFFDEPTAGLDPLRRNAVFAMIARYQRQLSFTALVVTHDVPEALVTSDRVALLDGGQLRFDGTPAEFSSSTLPVVTGFRDSVEALGNTLAALQTPQK